MLRLGREKRGLERAPLVLARASGPAKAASMAAVTTAVGAVACGVCCVLPFAVPAVAAASAGSVLAWFARAQSTMTLIASAIVAVAWLSVGVQTQRTQKRAAPATLYAMGAATLVLGVAIVWPRIEPVLIRVLNGGR